MRSFLVALVVLLLSTALLERQARATEPTPHARVEIASRASVRRLMAEGDLVATRTLLDAMSPSATSPEERAMLDDLAYVLEAWRAAGGRPRDPGASGVAAPTPDEEWPRAFAAAREALARGAVTEASSRFDAVLSAAPGAVTATRAGELRALAREAASRDREARAAAARDEATAPPPPAEENRARPTWYGWQTLLADGASIAVTPAVPLVGLGGYVLGGPIVHLAHGRVGAALGSLGLRVGAPIAGGTAAYLIQGKCRGDFCGVAPLLGAGVGLISAIALDSALLARAPGEETPRAERRDAKAPRFVPSAGPRREGGFDVGLTGTF